MNKLIYLINKQYLCGKCLKEVTILYLLTVIAYSFSYKYSRELQNALSTGTFYGRDGSAEGNTLPNSQIIMYIDDG